RLRTGGREGAGGWRGDRARASGSLAGRARGPGARGPLAVGAAARRRRKWREGQPDHEVRVHERDQEGEVGGVHDPEAALQLVDHLVREVAVLRRDQPVVARLVAALEERPGADLPREAME